MLLFATTWMDLKGIMLSEITKPEKDKYCMLSLIQGISKINKLVNITKKKQIHRYKAQTSGYQWGERGKKGVGEQRYKPLGIVSCKDILYNTGNITNIL